MLQQVKWFVRPAASHEWRYSLSLVPEIFKSRVFPNQLFVSLESPDSSIILGVGVAIPELKDVKCSGFSIFIRVVDAYRRQGIGTALVSHLKTYVASWDVPYVLGWQPYGQGIEQSFLLSCGFKPNLKVFCFESNVESADYLFDILNRNILNRYTPSDGEGGGDYAFKRLDRHNLYAEIILYAQQLMVIFDVAERELHRYLSEKEAFNLSIGLYRDGQLLGYLIGSLDEDDVPKAQFWVTQEHVHNSPVALLLLCYAIKNGFDLGYRRARFECSESAKTTLKVAKKVNAKLLYEMQSYALSTLT